MAANNVPVHSDFNPYVVLVRVQRAQRDLDQGAKVDARAQLAACAADLKTLMKDRADDGNQPAYERLQELLADDPLNNLAEVQQAAINAMPRVCMIAVDMTNNFDPDYTKVAGKVYVVYGVDASAPREAMRVGQALDLFTENEVNDDIQEALTTEMYAPDGGISYTEIRCSTVLDANIKMRHEGPELDMRDLIEMDTYDDVLQAHFDQYRASPSLYDSYYDPYHAMRSACVDIERGMYDSAVNKLSESRPAHYGSPIFVKTFDKAADMVLAGNPQGALAVLDAKAVSAAIEEWRQAGRGPVTADSSNSPSR